MHRPIVRTYGATKVACGRGWKEKLSLAGGGSLSDMDKFPNAHYMNNSYNRAEMEVSMRVTTADFIKHYGSLADRALAEPVTITKNGRDRLVVISADEFARLKSRDRTAVRPEELSAAEIDLIAVAEMPTEHAALDDELKGWTP